MKLYGLKSERQNCLMAITFDPNKGDFCNPTEATLSAWYSGQLLWTSDNLEHAEQICKQGSTKWFNSDYLNPQWSKDFYGKLKPVEL